MIRIYGRLRGYCSYASLTEGWRQGLAHYGLDPRVVGLQRGVLEGDESDPTGSVALGTDPMTFLLSQAFQHDRSFLVLAPHSPFVPDRLSELLERTDAILLAPSTFCAELLREVHPSLGVVTVPHGVASEYRPLTAVEREQLKVSSLYALRGPGVNFLHVSASNTDRKGTDLLIEAFVFLLKAGLDATLTCIAETADRPRLAVLAAAFPGQIRFLPRLNTPPSKMRWFYSAFDVVVQPSRVEGFGLCPLEALCCGVPAIVTQGTGHLQWLSVCDDGVVPVDLGPPESMALEPHPCPTVQPQSLANAIAYAAQHLDDLTDTASKAAPLRANTFDWTTIVKQSLPLFRMMQEET